MRRTRSLMLSLFDIQVFLLAVLCVIFLSPLVQRTIGTNGVQIIIGLYLLLGINPLINSGSYQRKTILLMLVYIGIVLLYTLIGKSDTGGGQTNNILFLFSFLFLLPVYSSLRRGHCVFILVVCILTLFITLAQNYSLFVRMGYRYTQQWYRISGRLEVINTQYVGAMMLFSGVIFSMFLNYKNKKYRILFLGMSAVCFLFNILVTQRAIALLLSIVMFSIMLLLRGEITRGKLVRYSFFTILLIIAVIEYQPLLNFIADAFDSDRIRQRVNSINTLITTRSITETEAGSLTLRLQLIGVSISTFFESLPNFLFGVGDKAKNIVIGNHSHFFDEFARFGIFGGTLSCWMILRMIKVSRNMATVEKTDHLYKFLLVVYIIAILRSFVGGLMAPSIGIALFVFTPLSFLIMESDSID